MSVLSRDLYRSPECETRCSYYDSDPPEGGCQQYCTLWRDHCIQRGSWAQEGGVGKPAGAWVDP